MSLFNRKKIDVSDLNTQSVIICAASVVAYLQSSDLSDKKLFEFIIDFQDLKQSLIIAGLFEFEYSGYKFTLEPITNILKISFSE